jgi:hypothetical protein
MIDSAVTAHVNIYGFRKTCRKHNIMQLRDGEVQCFHAMRMEVED